MSIESDLRKDGITVIGPIPTLTINSLASSTADKLCFAFPELHLNNQNLFIELSRLSMYTASIPEGIAEANYFYKNSSVYFREGVDLSSLHPFVVHELLHHLQSIRDKKGELVRLGLCEFGEFKIYGMGLNEGAVQLMTAKAMGENTDIVKYYDLSFPTCSPNFYPLLCNLVAQMAYITGPEVLHTSTFFGTDEFKNRFIALCGEKTYYKVSHNLDILLSIEEKIVKLQNRLLTDVSNNKSRKLSLKVEDLKKDIKEIFLQTQNLIFTSYFNREFAKISTLDEIETYRSRLYNYQNYIAIAEGYYTFHSYYINQMANLDLKHDSIHNNTALVLVKPNIFSSFLKAIKRLWKKESSSEIEFDNWK